MAAAKSKNNSRKIGARSKVNNSSPSVARACSRRILLDTGDANHSAYIGHLRQVLADEGARISTILLTHWHHDHIGGTADVLRSFGGTKDGSCQVWKFPRTDAPDHYPSEIPAGCQLHWLADRQQLSVPGATVQILHTPGHTSDHVCVQLLEERALFSGDCVLGEGTAVFEDLYEYMRSLKAILAEQPAVIYPAHGNVIGDPSERVQYYVEHREKREAQLLAVMRADRDAATRRWTRMELVHQVYGAEVPEQLWPAAAVNLGHHLEKLAREGRVEELNGETEERVWRLAAAEAKPRL